MEGQPVLTFWREPESGGHEIKAGSERETPFLAVYVAVHLSKHPDPSILKQIEVMGLDFT